MRSYWPRSARLLGDAYRERARGRPDGAAEAAAADLALALDVYVEAWNATPAEHEECLRKLAALELAIELAEARQ